MSTPFALIAKYSNMLHVCDLTLYASLCARRYPSREEFAELFMREQLKDVRPTRLDSK